MTYWINDTIYEKLELNGELYKVVHSSIHAMIQPLTLYWLWIIYMICDYIYGTAAKNQLTIKCKNIFLKAFTGISTHTHQFTFQDLALNQCCHLVSSTCTMEVIQAIYICTHLQTQSYIPEDSNRKLLDGKGFPLPNVFDWPVQI